MKAPSRTAHQSQLSQTEPSKLTPAEFHEIAQWVKTEAGIFLADIPKSYTLVEARSFGVLREFRLESFHDLIQSIRKPQSPIRKRFIEALTTNTTQFFRESKQFELMVPHVHRIMAEKKATGQRSFRVWCAASSTGEEPYTILMSLLTQVPELEQWDLRLLATDLNQEVLRTAAQGVYDPRQIQGVPAEHRSRFFENYIRDGQAAFRAKPSLQTRARFAPLNLIQFPYPFQGKFDFIFTRNVLIYFDASTCQQILKGQAAVLQPSGVLFLGQCESGTLDLPNMKSLGNAMFQKDPKS